jgi:pentatricopeptide repeat protein
VDNYDDTSVEEHLTFLRDPFMRRYAPPARPQLTISDHLHQVAAPSPEDVEKGDAHVQQIVTQLRASVLQRLLRPDSVGLEAIYDVYRSLPDQRMPYLTARLRHALFAALALVERKNAKSMLRYFAVVADVKDSGFTLTRTEWNTALSFASRYVGMSTETEAEAALHLWRDMEHTAGIKGDEVTFNILFDVASKAGKFPLAEMIYQEMNERGFEFNRYHHVSLIHFFGLKMDASGVRAAYREMVAAGEIIDSTALNCVIAGMLRSGEEDSAERVYEKMKASSKQAKVIPQRDYNTQKKITQVLVMFARIGRKHPDMQAQFQSTGLLSPDLHTYRILINHYGVKLGDLPKVAKFLDEMKWFRVPIHGAMFLALFKGFTRHSGVPGCDWSLQRLESVYTALLDAYDTGTDGLYISTWMAMWVLRAFAKCSQSKDRLLWVYDDLSLRWDLDSQKQSFMLNFLENLLESVGSRARPRMGQHRYTGTRAHGKGKGSLEDDIGNEY